MAKTQEKQAFITETSPIIMEHDQDTDDYQQGGFGCGCFRLFYSKNQSSQGDRINFLQQTGDHPHKERWLIKKLKELKEFSELVAGPKWKNFIRKFSKKPKNTRFQYDPQSYALNFNDGGCDDEEDDGFLARNFSTRFAPPFPDQQRRPATLWSII